MLLRRGVMVCLVVGGEVDVFWVVLMRGLVFEKFRCGFLNR